MRFDKTSDLDTLGVSYSLSPNAYGFGKMPDTHALGLSALPDPIPLDLATR